MRIKDFYALVELEQQPDAQILSDLKRLIDRFPLFQAGIFIYIKCLYLIDAPNYVSELNRLTPFVHDRRALFYYILSEVYDRFKSKPKTQQIEDRTNMLIDAFFETSNELKNENLIVDPLTYAIQNPSMASLDYLSYIGIKDINSSNDTQKDVASNFRENLNISSNVPKMKGQDIIDRFIANSDELETPILPARVDKKSATSSVQTGISEDETPMEEESEDDFFFTQTLVNIYIKQKKYERAYEIIKRLGLNYPEKNIYFADQLKYLEKYIQKY